jgi:hypothetical protein
MKREAFKNLSIDVPTKSSESLESPFDEWPSGHTPPQKSALSMDDMNSELKQIRHEVMQEKHAMQEIIDDYEAQLIEYEHEREQLNDIIASYEKHCSNEVDVFSAVREDLETYCVKIAELEVSQLNAEKENDRLHDLLHDVSLVVGETNSSEAQKIEKIHNALKNL